MKKKLVLAALLVMVLNLFGFARPASADTYVSGDITSDTTWDVAGSPYYVTGNIFVYGTDGVDGVTTLSLKRRANTLLQTLLREASDECGGVW